jgi:hypothetical protein
MARRQRSPGSPGQLPRKRRARQGSANEEEGEDSFDKVVKAYESVRELGKISHLEWEDTSRTPLRKGRDTVLARVRMGEYKGTSVVMEVRKSKEADNVTIHRLYADGTQVRTNEWEKDFENFKLLPPFKFIAQNPTDHRRSGKDLAWFLTYAKERNLIDEKYPDLAFPKNKYGQLKQLITTMKKRAQKTSKGSNPPPAPGRAWDKLDTKTTLAKALLEPKHMHLREMSAVGEWKGFRGKNSEWIGHYAVLRGLLDPEYCPWEDTTYPVRRSLKREGSTTSARKGKWSSSTNTVSYWTRLNRYPSLDWRPWEGLESCTERR